MNNFFVALNITSMFACAWLFAASLSEREHKEALLSGLGFLCSVGYLVAAYFGCFQ